MIWWEAELVEASYRTRGTDGYSTEFNILSWINYVNLCQSDFCICLWLMTFHGLWLPTVTIRNPALSCVTACTDFYQAPGPTELVAFHQPSFILAVAVPRFPPPDLPSWHPNCTKICRNHNSHGFQTTSCPKSSKKMPPWRNDVLY